MQLVKENKLLVLWWVIASAIAFYSFNYTSGSTLDLTKIENDYKPKHFTLSKNNLNNLSLYFDEKFKRQGFNGVVLVGQKDSVFFNNSYGYANYELRDSLNVNSSFELASVSKQFTAVAILQLYQKGLLNLTDTIQKFYPEFPYKGITIHQLLTHRSGLANYHYFLKDNPTPNDTLFTNQVLVNQFVYKTPKAYAAPDRRFQYSNSGYALLAGIVEKVTGISFNDYLHQNIFVPLNMETACTHKDITNGVTAHITQGYLRNWRLAESNHLDYVLGDKGVYCSAIDLFKWDQGLYKNEIVNLDTLRKAFEPYGKPRNSKSNYGYGWRMFQWKNDSIKILYHAGWWHGYKSLLIRIPQDSTTIVVLKNRSSGARINSNQILQILYPEDISVSDTLAVEGEE